VTTAAPRRTPSTTASDVRREGVTMALYLAIVLLAESVPLQAYDADSTEVLGAYWGSAIGLAAAHVFAFTVSARLVTHRRLDDATWRGAAVQILAAVLVALLATLPFWITTGEDAAFVVSGGLLAVLIGAAGFEAAWSAGASLARSTIVGALTLAVAAGVVVLKVVLTH
jgi:VIT1/CCC1 family predicted Fe2+/Mn2+ transporter